MQLISGSVSAIWVHRNNSELYADILAFSKRITRLIWIRGAVHAVGISSMYLSFKYLPITDALTLFHLKPFPTAVMCMLVLKEVISRVQVAAMGEK